MSISPKKHHGPEVKCGGPGMCPDCTDKYSDIRNIFRPDLLGKQKFCQYHVGVALVESNHNNDVLICKKCKEEKIPGRDGIYDNKKPSKN